MADIYFDNAATTYPKPEEVYREVDRFSREVGGSAGRSGHRRAVESGRTVFAAREALATLFNIRDPLRIAFTRNATEALNVAIRGMLKPGDHVVTTSMEHNSVMRPLAAAAAQGVEHTAVRCSAEGALDVATLAGELRPNTALVVLNHASNVTGTVLPVADVASLTRSRGIPLLVDAAQTAGRLAIDVEADGIDLLAFTGHKELFGPQGTGGLYAREGVEPAPLMHGGTGSHSVEFEQPAEMPDRLESGTLNAPGIAGLAAGVRFVLKMGVEHVRYHETGLMEMLRQGLDSMSGVRVFGTRRAGGSVGILSMTLSSCSPQQAAERLDRDYAVAARAGLHCAPAAHRTIGTLQTGTLRIGLSFMNNAEQVEYLLDCLREISAA